VLVLDSSAAVHVLTHRPANPDLLHRLAAENDLGAPHLIDIELLHALRRLVRTGKITEERAHDARADFDDLPIIRYPHAGVADRIWALRHNLTPYDAVFVAIAELIGCPLVTSDERLGRAAGHTATVEVYPHT
jgi:predicted nucleic acid-binding protein